MESLSRRHAMLRRRAQPIRLHRLDRLPALILTCSALGIVLSLFCPGCNDPDQQGKSQRSRVVAIKAQKPLESTESWCDVYHGARQAPRLKLPPLLDARSGGSITPLPKDRWIWLNLWATWCKPCLREMPLIERWMEGLSKAGVKIDLWYISVDEDRDALRSFLDKRPSIARKNSTWLSDAKALQPWLKSQGLSPNTTIPINFLLAPGDVLRCIRTGAINDNHYAIIRRFLQTER